MNGGAPEREDLHYGMNDAAVASYLQFQSFGVFNVIVQTVVVPQSVADQAIAEAIALGSAPKADCSHSISIIFSKLPGFEALPSTFFPNALSRGMAKMPGVSTQEFPEVVAGQRISLAAAPATN